MQTFPKLNTPENSVPRSNKISLVPRSPYWSLFYYCPPRVIISFEFHMHRITQYVCPCVWLLSGSAVSGASPVSWHVVLFHSSSLMCGSWLWIFFNKSFLVLIGFSVVPVCSYYRGSVSVNILGRVFWWVRPSAGYNAEWVARSKADLSVSRWCLVGFQQGVRAPAAPQTFQTWYFWPFIFSILMGTFGLIFFFVHRLENIIHTQRRCYSLGM